MITRGGPRVSAETSVGLVCQQIGSSREQERGKYSAWTEKEGGRGGGREKREISEMQETRYPSRKTGDEAKGRKERERRDTRLALSFTHLFLAELAHGVVCSLIPLSASLAWNSARWSYAASGPRCARLRASSSPSRLPRVFPLRENKKGGDACPTRAPRATTLVAEIRQCQRSGQSLHICLRLDVDAVVSRRVTASLPAARRRLFKTAEQPNASTRAL